MFGLAASIFGVYEAETVEVRVPVECREPMLSRPAMPTQALRPGVAVHDFTRAAMATRRNC